jgi:hypothetical protein
MPRVTEVKSFGGDDGGEPAFQPLPPDPHCRIASLRFKGSDHKWIIPREGPAYVPELFTSMTVGAVRMIDDGVIEVQQGD